MGAKESSTTAENHFIFKQELALGFSQSKPDTVFNSVLSKLANGRLSRETLRDVVYELRLTPNAELIEPFLASLVGHEEVDWRSLMLIGVLLSNGKRKQKAELVVKIFDADSSGSFTATQLKVMLASLAHVATELTIELACNTRAFAPQERLKSYYKSLKVRKEKMIEELSLTLLGESESISGSRFIELMQIQETSLMSTLEIRKRLEAVEYIPAEYLTALKSLIETTQG